MNWKNAKTDPQPEDEQKVLISVRGINYNAVFNKTLNGYKIEDGSYFMPRQNDIYWLEIEPME